jgi:hypothetical protein
LKKAILKQIENKVAVPAVFRKPAVKILIGDEAAGAILRTIDEAIFRSLNRQTAIALRCSGFSIQIIQIASFRIMRQVSFAVC